MDLFKHPTTEPTLAYLGGFIDGEGSISVIGGSVSLRVTNTNHAILAQLADMFGGTIVVHTIPTVRKKVCYQWVAYGETAADALEDLFPHLREKRMQAFMALEYRNVSPGDPLRPWIIEQLSDIKHLGKLQGVPYAIMGCV